MQRGKTEANTGGDTGPRRGSRAGQIAFACALLLIGLFSVYYPTLLSGFRQLQQNLGDPRLVNYVLEHGFRWVSRGPLHESLWAPPFYHPAPNVGALHDTLLGLGPLYWPLRWLGLPPDTAYQGFMLVVSVLNYAAAYAFMRLGLKVSTTAAAGGAFLFAFANPRTGRVLHQQLVAGYLPVLAVLCLVFLFRADSVTARRRWAAAVFVCWVAQMWSGFYWAWYLVFALCIAAVWSLARPGPRRAVAGALRDTWAVVFLSAAAALALTVPMVLQHLAAAAEVGFHDFEADVLPRTARLASWLYMGTPNLSYGLLQEGALFQSIPIPVEQQLGVGLITLLAVIWGLWTHRERRLVVVFVQVALTLALLSLSPCSPRCFREGSRSGVGSTISCREPAPFGPPHGRGCSSCCRWRWASLWRYQPSFDKLTSRAEVASIRNAVPPDCAVFYAVNRVAEDTDVAFNPWKYHLDAMWAQLDVGIPAVNGYSGFQPAGWRPLYPNVVRTVEERDQLESVLSEWLGEEMGGACMVEVTLP
jgi:hypothetical protein